MKIYHEIDKKSGKIVGIFFRPDEKDRYHLWQELITDEYDNMEISESVKFREFGQSNLVRIK